MKRTILLLLGLGAALGASAADHQRVAQAEAALWRWDTGLGLSLVPLGPEVWTASASPRLGVEWNRTWSASATASYRWDRQADRPGVHGRWADLGADLGWQSEGQEPRWRAGAGWSASLVPDRRFALAPGSQAVSADLGASLVRDPTILAAGLSLTVPVREVQPRPWSAAVSLSWQEVVNDNLVWSLGLAPRATWDPADRTPGGPRVGWTLAVSWGTGWYEGPWSATASAAAGSGAPWSFSASGGRSW